MCGRFTFTYTSEEDFYNQFDVIEPDFDLKPNYNVAPTHDVPVVVRNSPNKLQLMEWGFSIVIGNTKRSLINARGDEPGMKPTFRKSLRERRCIIGASGFYEWNIKDGSKQPYFIHPTKEEYFRFAGLWREEHQENGSVKTVFVIVTTHPGEKMNKLHNREPVKLSKEGMEKWLNKSITEWEDLRQFFEPSKDSEIEMYKVDKAVGSVKNNYPALLVEVRI